MQLLNITCQQEWPQLSLTNSRKLNVTIRYNQDSLLFTPPLPLSGISWENTLNTTQNLNQFLRATHLFLSEEKGSPGSLFSGNQLLFEKDLSLDTVFFDSSQGEKKTFILSFTQKGTETIRSLFLTVELDKDLDGTPDHLLYENTIELTVNDKTSFYYWENKNNDQGHFTFTIKGDDNLSNNQFSLFYQSTPFLQFTEVCPYPEDGQIEWFEIRNEQPYSTSLSQIQINNKKLISESEKNTTLLPGAFLIVTEDKKSFIRLYPQTSALIIQPSQWNTLNNSGDHLTLTFNQSLIHTMSYESMSSEPKGTCLAPSLTTKKWLAVLPPPPNTNQEHTSSPGSLTKQSTTLQWKLSSPLLDLSRPDSKIIIHITAPLEVNYKLEVFDLTGYPRNTLCQRCSGDVKIEWEGNDEAQNKLSLGSYILLLTPNSGASQKKIVVMARPL